MVGEGDFQRFKRLTDQIQKFGRKLVKPLRIGKQEWAKEKPKLDNARRLRGIYFIDPDDEEVYTEILRNGRRKLARPMAPTIPCKRLPNGITAVIAKP